ncbi:hypothetical protein FI98_03840 [Mycobacterium tuberculosis]|nr:hypothetical protein FI98_03840 [Mycobacterium tuberculosis]
MPFNLPVRPEQAEESVVGPRGRHVGRGEVYVVCRLFSVALKVMCQRRRYFSPRLVEALRYEVGHE